MNISLDIFDQNNIHYDWKTLYVGLKLDLITASDITNYAAEFLSKHPEDTNQNIIQLAWGEENLDYESLLEIIMQESSLNDLILNTDLRQFEKRKWRFGVLSCLKIKHQDDSEELLNKIAEVYADFNYPEDMDNFINYLVPEDGFNPAQCSKEKSVARLINLFNDFLQKEQQFLQKDTHC
ncbi:DUF2247 family protein [Bacillus sp. FSL W7-1360]